MKKHRRSPYRSLFCDALEIWNAGIEAVDAAAIVREAIRLESEQLSVAGSHFELNRLRKIIVVGFGKCSGAMAVGVESALQNLPKKIALTGIVNSPAGQDIAARRIEVVACRPAASNFPTETVVRQTRRMLELIEAADEKTLIVALVSGGGSALLEDPLVPLKDLVAVSKLISGQGASIKSLNTVRRALSRVKAGGLSRHVLDNSQACLIGLVISDVMGDQLQLVASGPTVISAESYRQRRLDALAVLEDFKTEDVPPSIFQCLKQIHSVDALSKPSAPDISRISNHLLASNTTAIDAAIARASTLGFSVFDSNLNVNQDVEVVAKDWLALTIRLLAEGVSGPTAIVVGGEPTVELCADPGCGGRNLQLAALLLRAMIDCEFILRADVAFLSGGSDGEDGSAMVAGAGFESQTLEAVAADDELRAALDQAIINNDCDAFFQRIDLRIPPPAISTNVCDVQVLLIRETSFEL